MGDCPGLFTLAQYNFKGQRDAEGEDVTNEEWSEKYKIATLKTEEKGH